MSLFSDDDESFQDENIAPKTGGRKKAAAVMEDSFDDDFSLDDDDGSDFEVTTKKTKANGGAAKATKAKAPAKSRKKPLKSVENEMSLDEEVDEPSPAPASTGKGKTKAGSASSQYQRLTQLQHVLKRPDTYIGSVEKTESKMWIYDKDNNQMVYKDVTIVPGLFKIFDELLVNAADNKIRDPNMDTLNVDIDVEANVISIYNNGRGIPVEMHTKENMYIPELIFGNLLTSSNYDDDEKKVTGGRNGYGAKVSMLCLFLFLLSIGLMVCFRGSFRIHDFKRRLVGGQRKEYYESY